MIQSPFLQDYQPTCRVEIRKKFSRSHSHASTEDQPQDDENKRVHLKLSHNANAARHFEPNLQE
jgi:hypothetical protein